VAIDPVPFKRDQAKLFGATHTAPSLDEAQELVAELTDGVMGDVAVCTIGIVEGEMIQPLTDLISKGGRAVLTGMARNSQTDVKLGLQLFSLFEKSLLGTVYGGCNPRSDIPRLAALYRAGKLQLDELITRTYTLEQVNEGYADMLAGKNIRGVIVNET
jgi:Zn-dependent alcohol dehydrogenase